MGKRLEKDFPRKRFHAVLFKFSLEGFLLILYNFTFINALLGLVWIICSYIYILDTYLHTGWAT